MTAAYVDPAALAEWTRRNVTARGAHEANLRIIAADHPCPACGRVFTSAKGARRHMANWCEATR